MLEIDVEARADAGAASRYGVSRTAADWKLSQTRAQMPRVCVQEFIKVRLRRR